MTGGRMFRAGIVLLALASLIDIVGTFTTDGEHPPIAIAVAGGVLGLVSLLLLVPAWRGNRAALGVAVGLRALSVLSTLPAFFVDDVPAAVLALVVGIILVNALGIGLVAPVLRRTAATT